MSNLMTGFKKKVAELWKDESAQGATEYIVLLAVVVIVVIIFKDRIRTLVTGRLDNLDSAVKGLDAGGQ